MDTREYHVKAVEYTMFRAGLYNSIMSQCTDALQDKLKTHPDYAVMSKDGIPLLKIIKFILHSFEQACHQEDNLVTIKTFYTFKQGNNMSIQIL